MPCRDLSGWKSPLIADLNRVASSRRWGMAILAIGWIHLFAFLACQVYDLVGPPANAVYVATWGLEFALVLAALRGIAGRGWYGATPLGGLIARLWATFLILSFNVASLNHLMGMEVKWFKPVLATLSSFGFMVMAYLLGARYFLLAVQMYFTGLLMALNPAYCYAIYGISWWAALQVIGVALERRRSRTLASVPEEAEELEPAGVG